MFHYTNKKGFDAIRSQPAWKFEASQPPGDHPVGAYFTTLIPTTQNLAKRLRIPKEKLQYTFDFAGDDGLQPIQGGRGRFILYSPDDYEVDAGRQHWHGPTGEWEETK